MWSPSRPRITGRLAFGPKEVEPTPGSVFKVSPRVGWSRTASSRSVSTLAGVARSNRVRSIGVPVTMTFWSWIGSSAATGTGGEEVGAAV